MTFRPRLEVSIGSTQTPLSATLAPDHPKLDPMPLDRRQRPKEPEGRSRARWGLVLALLAVTWVGMCYGIYAIVSAGKW